MGNKKVTTNKDEEAKAKVKDLLKGTSVANLVTDQLDEEEKIDKLNVNVIKKEKSMDWLQSQLDDALTQVDALENEIIFYKQELQNSQNNSDVSIVNNTNTTLPPNVIELFKHFEKVYERGYTDSKLAWPEGGTGVLDMFLEYFPQLQNVKTYRYRGQGQVR